MFFSIYTSIAQKTENKMKNVVLYFCIYSHLNSCEAYQSKELTYKIYKNRRSNVQPFFATNIGLHTLECARQCTQIDNCVAANYNSETCELFDQVKLDADHLSYSEGYTYIFQGNMHHYIYCIILTILVIANSFVNISHY